MTRSPQKQNPREGSRPVKIRSVPPVPPSSSSRPPPLGRSAEIAAVHERIDGELAAAHGRIAELEARVAELEATVTAPAPAAPTAPAAEPGSPARLTDATSSSPAGTDHGKD